MTSQERVPKTNKVTWTTKSRVIHTQISIPKQYQMIMWLGLNLLKPRLFLGIIPKASQTKFDQIQFTKSKVFHF